MHILGIGVGTFIICCILMCFAKALVKKDVPRYEMVDGGAKCPNCGTLNRLSPLKDDEGAFCSKCETALMIGVAEKEVLDGKACASNFGCLIVVLVPLIALMLIPILLKFVH